ncbi:MAG: GTPase [Bacillota bacterium]
MPANLTPQYLAAEERYRQAKTREDKIAALEEMLAVIPKHKGTDHLQGDIKRRLARLKEADEQRGGVKSYDPFLIEKEGAGQVALFGYANTGKSALVGALTRAKVTVADYPFATALPVAGMIDYEDIHIQMVDLPPVTADGMPKGMAGLLRAADLIAVVVDGGTDDCLEQIRGCLLLLRQKRIVETREETAGPQTKTGEQCLLIMTKADLPGVDERMELMRDIIPSGWLVLKSSVQKKETLDELRKAVFQRLHVIRVYSKIPGKEADLGAPFILKKGQTVLEMAALVHRDFPGKLKYARVWGSGKFPGQSVEKSYRLEDRDIVELHV